MSENISQTSRPGRMFTFLWSIVVVVKTSVFNRWTECIASSSSPTFNWEPDVGSERNDMWSAENDII